MLQMHRLTIGPIQLKLVKPSFGQNVDFLLQLKYSILFQPLVPSP